MNKEEAEMDADKKSEQCKRSFSEKETEERHEPEEEEDVEEKAMQASVQRIKTLQKDFAALVSNIPTAADLKESVRRAELEKAHRTRLERLENHARSCQDQYEELIGGWLSAKQKVIPQELQKALTSQQRLCSALIENKKKLISELQQELKAADDRYVRTLRRHAEELDLMRERMEEEVHALTSAYREEMNKIESIQLQESEALLTKDKAEWDEHMKTLWENEIERLTDRKKSVEEYENTVYSLMLEAVNMNTAAEIEHFEHIQALRRETLELKGSNLTLGLKAQQQFLTIGTESGVCYDKISNFKSLKKQLKVKRREDKKQNKEFAQRTEHLSAGYKCKVQKYEQMQKANKALAAANAQSFREVWLINEAEVKQRAERALLIDSLICKQHLGLSEKPRMSWSSPASQASMEPRESNARTEELSKVMELLCDEAGFLIEDKLLHLLAPLAEKEKQTVKLGCLVSALGIGEEDLPKLALFLLKYNQQQMKDAQLGASSDITETMNSNSIHLIHDMPALKCFLEQQLSSRERLSQQQNSLLDFETWSSSDCKTYWESLGNTISEDRVQLWEVAERRLKKHLSVLEEISELIPETERLKQQNTELRMLLQQSLHSKVNTGLEMI